MTSERPDESIVWAENGNPVIVFVCEKEFALRTEGYTSDPYKLAWFFAPFTEMVYEIAVLGATGYADGFRLVRVRPIRYPKITVRSRDNRYWTTKTGTSCRE